MTSHSPFTYLKDYSAKSPLLKKNICKVFQGKVDEEKLKQKNSKVNSHVIDSLGQLLTDLNMAEQLEEAVEDSTGEETEENTVQSEMVEMAALGLPISFGRKEPMVTIIKSR